MSCELIKLWARKCFCCQTACLCLQASEPKENAAIRHRNNMHARGKELTNIYTLLSRKSAPISQQNALEGEKKGKKKTVIFECNRPRGRLPAKFLRTCNFAHLHMGNSRTLPGTDIQKGIPPGLPTRPSPVISYFRAAAKGFFCFLFPRIPRNHAEEKRKGRLFH